MATARERAEQARQDKLDDLKQQVEDGNLTVRQMTPEERAKYPKPTQEELEARRNRSRRYGRS